MCIFVVQALCIESVNFERKILSFPPLKKVYVHIYMGYCSLVGFLDKQNFMFGKLFLFSPLLPSELKVFSFELCLVWYYEYGFWVIYLSVCACLTLVAFFSIFFLSSRFSRMILIGLEGDVVAWVFGSELSWGYIIILASVVRLSGNDSSLLRVFTL